MAEIPGQSKIEQALDELYQSDPAAFTATRDRLARELAKTYPEQARDLKQRRKPTQVAFLLNKLARTYPDDVAELVDVGRELARAHRKAIRGEAAKELREAMTHQREIITRLTQRASSLVHELELSANHLDEIGSALQAALIDPSVGAQFEEGRLEKAPSPASGFPGAFAPSSAAEAEDEAEEEKAEPASERRLKTPPPPAKAKKPSEGARWTLGGKPRKATREHAREQHAREHSAARAEEERKAAREEKARREAEDAARKLEDVAVRLERVVNEEEEALASLGKEADALDEKAKHARKVANDLERAARDKARDVTAAETRTKKARKEADEARRHAEAARRKVPHSPRVHH